MSGPANLAMTDEISMTAGFAGRFRDDRWGCANFGMTSQCPVLAALGTRRFFERVTGKFFHDQGLAANFLMTNDMPTTWRQVLQ